MRLRSWLAVVSSIPFIACGTGSSSDASVDPVGEGGSGGAQAGSSTAGSSTAGSSTAGSSTAGSSTAGSSTAGSSTAGSSTAGAAGASTAGTGGVSGSGPTSCPAPVSCDAAPPSPGSKSSWNHTVESTAVTLAGSANHRGRDLWLNPGDDQWLIAKFAYGVIDKDLKDEDVDVWLLRDCKGPWELLGTTKTTASDGMHPTVENVDDSGGRVYFQIPAAKKLGKGRHRAHFVVKGDLTTTDAFLEIVDPATPLFVSDVDGTLTTSETEEYGALLTGSTPQANPDAAKVFQALVAKGYRPFYMTARPEFLVERTREFVKVRGFPEGLVHTTLGLTGALGGAASTYKTDELAQLAKKGLVPTYAFGNTSTDADGYFNAMVKPDANRVFFQFTDSAHGGRRIEAYAELFAEVAGLPFVCK